MLEILNCFQLGEPVEHRGVVVAPLFPTSDPACAYITLDEALPRGLAVTETDPAGTVSELWVQNRLDANVLLYDGEELLGADDRTLRALRWSAVAIALQGTPFNPVKTVGSQVAEPLVDTVVEALRGLGAHVETGRFRTEMHVELVNDGPVTLAVETGMS